MPHNWFVPLLIFVPLLTPVASMDFDASKDRGHCTLTSVLMIFLFPVRRRTWRIMRGGVV